MCEMKEIDSVTHKSEILLSTHDFDDTECFSNNKNNVYRTVSLASMLKQETT